MFGNLEIDSLHAITDFKYQTSHLTASAKLGWLLLQVALKQRGSAQGGRMRMGKTWEKAAILGVLLFFGAGCGGGGGSDTSSKLTGIQETLDAHSDTAVDYFSAFESLLRSVNDLGTEIAGTASTDEEAQARIFNKLSNNIIPKADDLSVINDELIQLEAEIEGATPMSSRVSLRTSSPTLQPEGLGTAIVTGICAVGTMASFGIALDDASVEFRNDLQRCVDLVKQYEESQPSDQTPEERADYIRFKWAVFDACYDSAVNDFNNAGIWASIGGGLGLVGSKIPSFEVGQLTVTASSAYLDAAQIYLWITRPGNAFDIEQIEPSARLPYADSNADMEMFITKVDRDGTFTAPVGDWNLVAYRQGYVRMGNPQGERVSFSEGATTEILIDPAKVDEVNEEDLVCSTDDGNDSDPGDGASDSIGSMSGSFSATCSDGYSDGSSFSVTIAADGTVTGIYDYGNIDGGVSDGFMSVTMDGYWSDCVMGGELRGSGSTLSGSGTVSCSGGSCYGTWSAAH